jgi:hypothetical protein
VKSAPYTRRSVLRAIGSLLALPALPSLGLSHSGARQATRLAYVYVPNGVHMPDWTPAEAGRSFTLPSTLEPLAPFREHLTVLSGLAQDFARAHGDGPGDHARAGAVWLTGVKPLKTDGQVRLGISADQVAAQALAKHTPFRSLQLGCERGGTVGQCDSGYSCAYSSHISWQNETTPAGKEVRPSLVFDRLFRGGGTIEDPALRRRRQARRESVLDYALAEARRARRALDEEDRTKLDEYLSGVRELERRIDQAEEEWVSEVPDEARPAGTPSDYGEHLRLMMDLAVLAFQTDRTRVLTLLAANEGSNRSYPDLGIREGHHSISHHQDQPDKLAMISKINRFHVEQLAYFLGKLKAAREGSGSLLDRVMLVYGSGISDGNRHNHDQLPTLLIGGGGGALSPGEHLVFEQETPLNNLHLALLHKLGVRVDSLGDGTGPLAGI